MSENITPEIVRQGSNAPIERKPVTTIWENNQAEQVETPLEEKSSLQMYYLLVEGKLPLSEVPLYFQKQKQEDLDRATGALYRRTQPINSVERKFWKVITAQHDRILAEDYSDQQKIAREVAAIEARYEPLINGTSQDHARYFANEAITISLNHNLKKPEDITRSNVWASNLYGLASRLSRKVVVEQATSAGKSTPVVAASKTEGQQAT